LSIRLASFSLFLVFCLSVLPALSYAADSGTSTADGPTRGQLKKMQTLNDSSPIPKEAIVGFYNKCMAKMPKRFMPGSLELYCGCASAALQGELTSAEFEEIKIEKNQKIRNRAYEKYVTKVVAPCMATPTQDIEYYSCVLDRTLDVGISSIPRYCQCVGYEMSKKIQSEGDSYIVQGMGQHEWIKDPIESLWQSNEYKATKADIRKDCIRFYWKKPIRYN